MGAMFEAPLTVDVQLPLTGVAAEVYPNKLKEICGNTGTEGLYPFEVL